MQNNLLARVLLGIPDSRTDGLTSRQIADSLGESPNDHFLGYVSGVADLLAVIGAIIPVEHDPGSRIVNRSHSSLYFLRLLAEYAQIDETAIAGWEAKGVDSSGPYNGICGKAVNVIGALEARRQLLDPKASPIRRELVAQALITRPSITTDEMEYLVQYDPYSMRYQFIGGRYRESDLELIETMRRELAEELKMESEVTRELGFIPLAQDVPFIRQSMTYGVLTDYRASYYHARNLVSEIAFDPKNRWVTLDEMRSALTVDGKHISSDVVMGLPIDWSNLPSSFDVVMRP